MDLATSDSVRRAQERADRRVLAADPPAPLDRRELAQVRRDLRTERAARRRGPLPPGDRRPSLSATLAVTTDLLGLLLTARRRHGPVFCLRHAHQLVVWAISPAANQQIFVSDADAFTWRDGRFRDLWHLLGDGFFAIDGDYHRAVRRMMLPAFHAGAVEAAGEEIVAELTRAVDELRPGVVDVNRWVRDAAMRVALRVLLGIDRSDAVVGRIAEAFERALLFHDEPLPAQMLRGPLTPYARLRRARADLDELVLAELKRRRADGDPGRGVLGLLLACTDPEGAPLPASTIRDLAMTVLFAGHDTTTATFSFLVYELGRNPHAREAVEDELARELHGRAPTAAQLDGRALPVLERTLDETLRRYPVAHVHPRKVVRDVELDGVFVPAGLALHASSWATHHLPELYPAPLAFDPDRFLPGGQVAQLPRGSYLPFGGGSRMCLGKRFAQYELRALTAIALQRLRFDCDPAEQLKLSYTPTLGPRDGLSCIVTARA